MQRTSSFMWSAEARPTDRVTEYGDGGGVGGGTMSRLRRGIFHNQRQRQKRDNVTEDTGKGKLGMIEGVFFRVLTNLFGVILFLRLGWLTAYAGIGLAILVVLLSSSLTLTTALSLSAICTNGKVAAGGAYYLISRALGPEFGASIGVLFYVATAVSISLYLLGFAETVVNQIGTTIINEDWDLRFIAFLGLIFCQMVCLVGVSVVVKVEKIMLFIVIIAVCLFVIGVFIGPDSTPNQYGFVGLQSGLNTESDFPGASTPVPSDLTYLAIEGLTKASQCITSSSDLLRSEYGNVNLGITLSVFFPAVTGILAGANISGDLKNPSYAIPTGTVIAIILGAFIYIILVVIFGASFERVTVSGATFAHNTTDTDGATVMMFNCQFSGLFHDSTLIAMTSVSPGFVFFGIYAASLSSGLASLLGAPRILQALAKDRLFSTFDPLAKGYGPSDEPLRAYAVTFIIAALCILTGDINSVAPLITTFFLASYSMVNYACFSAEESNSPGWRPTFRYFDKWLAFLGALGCITVMLFLSAITGFVTFTIGLGLYKYVEVSVREGLGSASNWGPHKESAEYNTALDSVLLLEEHTDPSAFSSAVAASNQSATQNLKRRSGASARHSVEPTSATSHTEIELSGVQKSGTLDDDYTVDVGPGLEDEMDDTLDRDDHHETGGSFMAHDSQFDTTHVKNYRPQCLVLSGPPRQRPALALFVAGLRKARGVTVFGDILVGDLSDPSLLRLRNMRAKVSYVSQFGIKAFNDVIIAPSFRTGCRSLMQVSGLGRRMRVNTVVMGFLDEWRTPMSERLKGLGVSDDQHFDADHGHAPTRQGQGHQVHEDLDFSPPPSVADYVGVIGDAFDLGLGVTILRGELDLLRSEYLTQTVQTEMDRVLSLGLASAGPRFASQNGAYQNPNYTDVNEYLERYEPNAQTRAHQRTESIDLDEDRAHHSSDGTTANADMDGTPTLESENSAAHTSSARPVAGVGAVSNGQDRVSSVPVGRKSAKRIDVWWLVDDGGLTIMLPHILRQASSPPWVGCKLRVMAIGASEEEARTEEKAMEQLLTKLRIPAEVSIVALNDFDAKAQQERSGDRAEFSMKADDDRRDSRLDSLDNVALDYDDSEYTAQNGEEHDGMADVDAGDIQHQLYRAYSSMEGHENTTRQSTYEKVGKLIARFSADALIVFVSLPVPPMSLDPEEYMKWLDLLSKDCAPPVLMVRGSQRDVVTTIS